MSDDLFSRLFELFNQPGPVNLRLAGEVARHLVGDKVPIDPWSAEEYRELTRLAEFRIGEVAPFPVPPAPDVLPVDSREWAERNLDGFVYLAEPFSNIVDLGDLGPGAAMMGQLAPAMVGMQLGTLVGSLAEWVMASFDAGVPVMGEGPITYVVPRIDAFAADHGFETRDVHLWVALHEACHRAMYRVPFTGEHLSELVDGFASKLKIGPDTLMELMQGFDPSDPSGGIDPDRVAGMFDNPESEASRKELEAFLGLAAGYRRLLVERAAGNLLPGLAELEARRDEERTLSEAMASSAFAATFVQPDAIAAGRGFCEEVAVRFGEDAVRSMWTRQGRFPAAAEIADPTAWAARVLLEDLG